MSLKLRRTIGLAGLIFYGVGTMVGGGIYALLGKVTGEAGIFSPWALLIAGGLAIFSALSFAELSSRLPFSGGPAKYVTEAFHLKSLGTLFGWLVIATGVVSAATLTVAMSGFFVDLLELSSEWGKMVVVMLLLGLACWGIKQSVIIVAIVTSIEVIGLLLVIGINADSLSSANFNINQYMPGFDPLIWSGILSGSFVAFYAFIGFEDMVTLAEEVKDSESNLPKAIIISLVITLLLYVVIALVAVSSSNLSLFVESNTPMAYLVRDSSWLDPQILILISLLAGFNGALVQVIMASRVLYGMSKDGQAPNFFSRIYSKTQTPIVASVFTAFIVYALASLFDLIILAKLTSGIILFVFAGMNLSLIKIKHQGVKHTGFRVNILIPVIGMFASLGCLFFVVINL
ncbi:MAG: APA family basic amino acid/polyamine antiporter [Enterobacterales bacterium]|jgi:APA family basic amino acid/polyamine antiporter